MRVTTDLGVFEIDSLPSQVQCAVSHGFFLHEQLRGKGLATQLHQQQIEKMIELGYDFAICTVSGVNPAQSKALKNAGWNLNDEFRNSRMGYQTQFWSIDLQLKRLELATQELKAA